MGTDLLLMGAYRFKKYIALDFGGAFAKLKNIVSGYCNGIVGAAAFNQEGSHATRMRFSPACSPSFRTLTALTDY